MGVDRMSTNDELEDIKNRAEKFIAAHDEMCRIGEGIGGLAVHRPELLPDWDAWSDLSDVNHADTVLGLIEARKPRTITTVEELEHLQMVVVRTTAGSIANVVDGRAYFFGYEASAPVGSLSLPATVLWEVL